MAFRQIAPTSRGECLQQLVLFCTEEFGWEANWNGDTATIIPWPTDPLDPADAGPGDVFTLRVAADIDYAENMIRYTLTDDRGVDVIDGMVNSLDQFTRAWFYGADSGPNTEAWCYMVIESAPGMFHNLYFGYVRKYGTWDGGAIIDGDYWNSSHNDADDYVEGLPGTIRDNPSVTGYDDDNNHLLLSGTNTDASTSNVSTSYLMGGMSIRLPDFSFDGCRFVRVSNSDTSSKQTCYGGPGDNHNWKLVEHLPAHTGQSLIAPMQLFCRPQRTALNIIPVGEILGIFMVNVDDLDPAELYFYAGVSYRIFPIGRKEYISQAIAVVEE